ncbi:MAG TPA: CPXCG motif-containing cysteine-rich protein [Gammaproteobacteria bacterium]|nr:CPXCG motif-containing cysteine-rich protein [Gammaproteobacteria bacterium]
MNPEEPVTISCPYCGESQVKVVDLADMTGEYIEDCEVCCQPMILVLSMPANKLTATVTREDE